MKKALLATLVAAFASLVVSPAHAVTPLGQSSMPVIITVPGSYIVTQNLTGVTGGPTAGIGILVAADDVTLDLNGHVLTGVPGASHAIFVYLAHQNFSVKNGHIRGWPGDGIQAPTARNTHVHDVRVSACSGYGIRLGAGSLVEHCGVMSNGLVGIQVRDGSFVTECTSVGNGGNGIEASNGCSVVNNVIFVNRGNGIRAGSGSRITGNHCMSNGTFIAGSRSGILIDGSGSVIKNNHVAGSDRGFDINGNNNIFVENTAADNNDDILQSAGNIGGLEVNIETGLQAAANSLINVAQ
jgi:hypothetical protein